MINLSAPAAQEIIPLQSKQNHSNVLFHLKVKPGGSYNLSYIMNPI